MIAQEQPGQSLQWLLYSDQGLQCLLQSDQGL